MSTVTQPRPRVKPGRTVRLALAPSEVNPFAVVLIADRAEDTYHVRPLPSDFGTAFEVEKIAPDGRTYHVNLEGQTGTCECLGHLRRGTCRHVQGLQALQAAGKL